MNTKFTTSSSRVKGIAFHPTRPLLLVSLHTGAIQLFDYQLKTLVDRFEEHEGPVRCVDFHPVQPLFASGGDDFKVKVWNYKDRRVMFDLEGHLDYIRTVQFHAEQPWILSCSDDQTVRIWNWQSRSALSILTGHNHYVMCAQFHPKENLVVSCSLDQTIRVWDISGVRHKSLQPSRGEHGLEVPSGPSDFFGSSDGVVKHVLEGHDRGVNWVSFHPNVPLIVSASDDRQIKIWRMSEHRAWEVDSISGHGGNVSCVRFIPKHDLIVSNSEDRTLRLWDLNQRTCLKSIRMDHDRFWVLAVHPEQNLIAAGHDSGAIVYKLGRERTPFTVHDDFVFYVKDRELRMTGMKREIERVLCTTRKLDVFSASYKGLSYSPAENALILNSDVDRGTFEIFTINSGGTSASSSGRGSGTCATFVTRNRFCVIERDKTVALKGIGRETIRKISLPGGSVESLYKATTGRFLAKVDDKVVLYDLQAKKVVSDLHAPKTRYVIWQRNMSSVAILSRKNIQICSKNLDLLCSVHESGRIKSATMDDSGVVIYSTHNHLKYCLPNGDHGIIRSLEAPVFVAGIHDNMLFFFSKEGVFERTFIDTTEFRFKLALEHKRFDEVHQILKKTSMCGQSIVAYLHKKGHPEIAIRFVKDVETKFHLALEYGNIDVAMECAQELDRDDCWDKLAREAMKQGNTQMVELAYQKTRNFSKLSFLYLITGNTEKLKKMQKIAEMRQDMNSRFHNSFYINDVMDRIHVLVQTGQLHLAYATAKSHGFEEESEKIATRLDPKVVTMLDSKCAAGVLIHPRTPIFREANWPMLNVNRGSIFEAGSLSMGMDDLDAPADVGDIGEEGGWDVGGQLMEDESGKGGESEGLVDSLDGTLDAGETGGGMWQMDDLDLPDLPDVKGPVAGAETVAFVPTRAGKPPMEHLSLSSVAAYHIFSGSFDSAMKLLNRTAGIVNFDPLKPYFMHLYSSSHFLLSSTTHAPVSIPMMSPGKNPLPLLPFRSDKLIEKLKAAYALTTFGKFAQAIDAFRAIMYHVVTTSAASKDEASKLKELLSICQEYVTALTLEIQKKEVKNDPKRVAELAVYFTHCNIQPVHLMLALRSAMVVCYKLKNFKLAGSLARRLIDFAPKQDVLQQARKVAVFAEQHPTDQVEIEYDERNPFVICCKSWKPIYRGSDSRRCPLCLAHYRPEHEGSVCDVCQLAEVGKDVVGLQLLDDTSRI
eukprot:TRINITY_DN238_c0_g4_i2.p1 TRINITY_DN238_c0_g4~~TRINITY_DN238_c0_g4_i2.p1  ORF type:complete len:1215 (-),score=306.65 TRINITY_DN238_c0_g4_i2:181-3825(-)